MKNNNEDKKLSISNLNHLNNLYILYINGDFNLNSKSEKKGLLENIKRILKTFLFKKMKDLFLKSVGK